MQSKSKAMEIENKFDKITEQAQNNVVNFNIVTNNISQPMNGH